MGICFEAVRTSSEKLAWLRANSDQMGCLLCGKNVVSDGSLRGDAVFGRESAPGNAEFWVLELYQCWDLMYAAWTGVSLIHHLDWTDSRHPLRRQFIHKRALPPPTNPPPGFGLLPAFVGDAPLAPGEDDMFWYLTPARVAALAREWRKVDREAVMRRFKPVEDCYLALLDENYLDEACRGLLMLRDFYQRAAGKEQAVMLLYS